MVVVFISHSKRDRELVENVRKILVNIGHIPIIEEFIPMEAHEPVPYEKIRKNVERSDFVLLFLTDNVVATEYTRNWVIFEDGLAAQGRKRLVVFERVSVPIPYPIPYVTDYAIFNPYSTDDILEVQAIVKKIGEIPKDIITGIVGALVGTVFGPLGLILGALAGYTLGPKSEQPMKVQCHNCKVTFNYWSPSVTMFNCPCCRTSLDLRGA